MLNYEVMWNAIRHIVSKVVKVKWARALAPLEVLLCAFCAGRCELSAMPVGFPRLTDESGPDGLPRDDDDELLDGSEDEVAPPTTAAVEFR